MKKKLIIIMLGTILLYFSCKKDELKSSNDFCSIKPAGWECFTYYQPSASLPLPEGVDAPDMIIKYINKLDTFVQLTSTKINPSLILYVYDISQKDTLKKQIEAQGLYSWCIPIFYGENLKYFVISSPCYINGGNFTNEANQKIESLNQALKKIFNDYNHEFIN